MHLKELFFKPGLEPASDVIENLASAPRELHLTGQRFSVLWRILVFLFSLVCVCYLAYIILNDYLETASIQDFVAIVVILPLPFTLIPWWLISSWKHKINSYKYYEEIYRDGIACIGTINTMTHFNGNTSHHFGSHKRSSPMTKIRVDYTFDIEDPKDDSNESLMTKTGTIILPESTIGYLDVNTEVCVLYLKEDPSKNMIFPLPAGDFFDNYND